MPRSFGDRPDRSEETRMTPYELAERMVRALKVASEYLAHPEVNRGCEHMIVPPHLMSKRIQHLVADAHDCCLSSDDWSEFPESLRAACIISLQDMPDAPAIKSS